jgi:hypothetical protein
MPQVVLYALWGERSGSYLTQDGRIIFHTDRAEMEFLFPGVRVVALRGFNPLEGIPLKFVRGMEAVQFPLIREDFTCRS